MNRFKAFFSKERVILSVYVLISVIIGVQHYRGGPGRFNNFVIFRQALFHLLEKKNLHIGYPDEYGDLFLYHPTFCIFFAPFSYLPTSVSLILWLITCSLVLFYGIRSLPLSHQQKVFFWWFALIELSTSLHNQQTNPIIIGLGLFAFSYMERNKPKWASLFPVLAFCIKGYGLIFASLFMFYPGKSKYILYSVFWMLFLGLLPLPLLGWDQFIQIYEDWVACLIQDHGVNYGWSVMGLIKLVHPTFTAVSGVQIAGVVMLAFTLLRNLVVPALSPARRLLLLSYICLWVILFNHAAESPTYIIAIAGVSIFYVVNREVMRPWVQVLAVLVFFFSILAPVDVYPPAWRQEFFKPYLIKVIPCLLVWIVLQIQLITLESDKNLRA